MNIEQINSIELSVILDKMGRKPIRENNEEVAFCAPWRDEKKPNLTVRKKDNVWYDHVLKRGGKVLQIIQVWLESQGKDSSAKAALAWGREAIGYLPRIKPVQDDDDFHYWDETDENLKLLRVVPIEKNGLIKYAESRGIPPYVMNKYFVEVQFLNKKSGVKNYALGMKNESDGYEVRHPHFKGCVGPRDIIYVRGENPKASGINIFEEPFDFLSAITRREGKPFEDDTIIMTSMNCLVQAAGFVKGKDFTHCYTWMDNDEPGQKATQAWKDFCATEEKLIHVPMNNEYEPYKDVNAHHMAKLEL
jgi:hypothetical protein